MIGAIGGGGMNAVAGTIGAVSRVAGIESLATPPAGAIAADPEPSSIVRISLAGQHALAHDLAAVTPASGRLEIDIQALSLSASGADLSTAGRLDQLVIALLLALLLQDKPDNAA